MNDYEELKKELQKKGFAVFEDDDYAFFIYPKNRAPGQIVPTKQSSSPWWISVVQIVLQLINIMKGFF